MTIEEFRGLSRGDIVVVDGNGACVVEGVFYRDSMIKVDLLFPRGCIDRVRGIPETEAKVIRHVPRREPPPDSLPGILLAEERARTGLPNKEPT
jgi:hypothetical protein